MSSREVIQRLKQDGWYEVTQVGSHKQFKYSKDAVAFLVPAYSERTIRVNITAPESQIVKVDRLARSAGLTRSAFFVRSAIQSRPTKEKKHKGKKKVFV